MKKWLSSALEKAKEVWQSKKCQKMERLQSPTVQSPLDQHEDPVVEEESNDATPTMQREVGLMILTQLLVQCLLNRRHACQSASMSDKDLDQPLAECRGHRENCQLPKHYRDILRKPPAALPRTPPPAPQLATSECVLTKPLATAPGSPLSKQALKIDSLKLLKSTQNKFGLFWQYHAACFPDHDPNENITCDDLMDMLDTFSGYPADFYHPYLTQSSFLLGE